MVIKKCRDSARWNCGGYGVVLVCVCIVGSMGCAGGGSLYKSEFGRTLWIADLARRGTPSRTAAMRELERLSNRTNCLSRITPADVFQIWDYNMRMVPSFDPVCISEAETYYVVSGGEPPRGSIWNSGYLLVNKSDGSIWNQGAKEWIRVGFTTLTEEEVRRLVPENTKSEDVLDLLGSPFSGDTEPERYLRYFGPDSAVYDIVFDRQSTKVVRVECGVFRRK
jgi:hypothetical protein